MSDEGAEAPAWSSGLTRSYSEHAALVLQHFQQQHRRATPRCTRSGPDFRALQSDDARSEADDEDEDEEAENNGRRTWRISNSEGENQSICQRRRKTVQVGCGDSGTLTDEFSELSLKSQLPQNGENYGYIEYSVSSTSQNTKTSVERRCRMFDDDEDDDDDRFALLTNDIDEHYRPFRQQSSESDTPNESSLRDSQSMTSQSKDHDDNNNDDSASCSCSSLSAVATTTTNRHRLNGADLKRLISYENWARKTQEKEQQRREATRRAEQLRREAEELEQRAREEKERRDYENFLHWVERKKKEKKLKKAIVEKELDLQKTIQNIEDKVKIANVIRLRQWKRKKVEERKASEKQELMKQKRTEEEKQRRLQESVKAYEKWRVKAKNTPRPATQGLLPHQKAKPAFTNPTPWQPLVDGNGSDADSDVAIQPRSAGGAVSKNQRSKRTCVKR